MFHFVTVQPKGQQTTEVVSADSVSLLAQKVSKATGFIPAVRGSGGSGAIETTSILPIKFKPGVTTPDLGNLHIKCPDGTSYMLFIFSERLEEEHANFDILYGAMTRHLSGVDLTYKPLEDMIPTQDSEFTIRRARLSDPWAIRRAIRGY